VHEFLSSDVPAYALSAAFGLAGIIQLARINIARDAYLRWDYPIWICRLTGGLELLAAIVLATASIRLAGVLLAAGINFVIIALLLKNRAYRLALPGLAAMAALPFALIAPH